MEIQYLFFYASQFVSLLVQVLTSAIFLRAIFSWFVPPGSDNVISRFLRDITEPILSPLRAYCRRWECSTSHLSWP